ncbi:MAG: response regulator transcription factor [Clostridia bacterium]|nr:response regulator transcription factor [Clostridia bacterium]
METLRTIHVLIVDDDAVAREAARECVGFFVEPENVHTAGNSVEMMRVLTTIPIDLAFLDMEMPDIDGFSVADYLKRVQPKTQYVFLTGHTELGAKSYEYEPLDFLIKPVNVMRMQKTFERFDRTRKKPETHEKIAVETTDGFEMIDPYEIRFISRDNRKAVIHCGEKSYATTNALGDLEIMFGDYRMIRCHQSFLLSLDHVKSAQKTAFGRAYYAVMDTGEQVPVSRAKFPELKEILEKTGTRFV